MTTEETPWTAASSRTDTFGGAPPTAQPDDSITVSYDGTGAPCPAQRPFQPQLSLLADPFTAGQDTHLMTTIKQGRPLRRPGVDRASRCPTVSSAPSARVPLCSRSERACRHLPGLELDR